VQNVADVLRITDRARCHVAVTRSIVTVVVTVVMLLGSTEAAAEPHAEMRDPGMLAGGIAMTAIGSGLSWWGLYDGLDSESFHAGDVLLLGSGGVLIAIGASMIFWGGWPTTNNHAHFDKNSRCYVGMWCRSEPLTWDFSY
jgi:hypothetical protein